MPAPIPIGSPMRQAIPTMRSVPTSAWATPPPVSPAGAGILVKKSSERLPAPLRIRLSRMKKSGSRATMTAPIINPTIRLLNALRRMRRFMLGLNRGSQGAAPGSRPAGHPPDEEPGAGVYYYGHQEEQ